MNSSLEQEGKAALFVTVAVAPDFGASSVALLTILVPCNDTLAKA